MHARYVTDLLKIRMKKLNAEKILFYKFTGHRSAFFGGGGGGVSIACSEFFVAATLIVQSLYLLNPKF